MVNILPKLCDKTLVTLIGIISSIILLNDNKSCKLILSSITDLNKIQVYCYQFNKEHITYLKTNTIIKINGVVKNDKSLNIIVNVNCSEIENLKIIGVVNENCEYDLIIKQRNINMKMTKFTKLISLIDLNLNRSVIKIDIMIKKIFKLTASISKEHDDNNNYTNSIFGFENISLNVSIKVLKYLNIKSFYLNAYCFSY